MKNCWIVLLSTCLLILPVACSTTSEAPLVDEATFPDQPAAEVIAQEDTEAADVAGDAAQELGTAQAVAMERGYSEESDFVGTYTTQWQVEGQPARDVLIRLNDDGSAELGVSATATEGTSATFEGTWTFEPGVASLTMTEINDLPADVPPELTLEYTESGLKLHANLLGPDGLPVAKTN